jgi:hypothetical protein
MRVPRTTAAKSSFSLPFSRASARAALALAGGLVCASVSRPAGAHIKMSAPADWITTNSEGDPQKITPCGVDPTMPSTYTVTNAVTTVHVGDQVTVNWTETVPHDGHFRIALAINSRDELTDPAVTQMNSDGTAEAVAISTSYPVLADNLFPHMASQVTAGKAYTYTVTIPNMTCSKCTLQLLQFMANHPKDPSYFYHQCADFTILGTGSASDAGATGSGGTGSGGAKGAGGATGSGGATASGGTTGSGGASASGGATGSGGKAASGGATGAGGVVSSGGTTGSGGAQASGGSTGSGGAQASGGSGGSGDSTGSGGSTGSSGSAGSGDSGSSGCSYATGGASPNAIGIGFLLVALTALRRGRRARR